MEFVKQIAYCLSILLLTTVETVHESHVTLTVLNFTAVHVIKRNFLSVAIDSRAIIKKRWCKIDWKKIAILAKALSPAYLRLGGTEADGLIFDPNGSNDEFGKNVTECDYEISDVIENFTMTGRQWDQLNHFAKKSNFDIIFDLNILLRDKNRNWNEKNAAQLLTYSQNKKFSLHFELGNEPNHLSLHVPFNESAIQLAVDYKKLTRLLKHFPLYQNSFIIGPSTTQLDRRATISYFDQFFESGGALTVDAATFHHYYFGGPDVSIDDFLNTTIYDSLIGEIEIALKTTKKYEKIKKIPVWLGETADAYGGGAEGLSNSFASTFIWMDKLGLAAVQGISLVIRQSLFGGYYGLIDKNGYPNPNYWISLLHKRLALPNVIKVLATTDEVEERKFLRFYAHCLENQ